MPNINDVVKVKRRSRERVLWAGFFAIAAGAVICALLPLLSGAGFAWWISAQLVAYMLASTAVSGVIGFIFGVPRARQPMASDATAESKVRFAPNSNLEEISDWLTKLLVGAGLVQLAVLPSFLRKVGDYLGAPLGFAGGPGATVAIVLYGAAVGFIVLYVWARLRLRVLLEESEVKAKDRWDATQWILEEEKLAKNGRDEDRAQRSIRNATTLAHNTSSLSPILWVDDVPENNAGLVAAFESVGIDVTQVVTTAEALEQNEVRFYGLIITDYGRKEMGKWVPDAGVKLLERLARESVGHPPVLVYTGRNGLINRSTLIEAGAMLVTASPSQLFETAVKTLADQATTFSS